LKECGAIQESQSDAIVRLQQKTKGFVLKTFGVEGNKKALRGATEERSFCVESSDKGFVQLCAAV
jgi:hypothetical protein